mmetsp:Transcript_165/g.253  ORF Transcript_165/g.253 Transcript_165/m.253 type:complete len:231 (-) Transcript_165:134-826(-)|eukprot:CAMPEP_0178407984 /NCGR_PEP_ID=MMETSP0689_2-20121128/19706_1 /TAXON_ID=160604 /ORGANISM="Amphidinium massartii, Strain CS-259" /LENGTH=230 /DNA_ID=CAMNT_0020029067 /DNA_START=84 /DNA_END=776 /DNA_ORIENTATION=+
MFSCTACKPSDPATATVKVNPALINGADKENQLQQQQQQQAVAAEKERQQREEREQREREVREQQLREQAEQQRRELERKEAERREAAERRQREEEVMQARWAEERRAAQAEQKRLEEAAQRKEEARKKELLRKEQEDAEKVKAFLQSKGYGEDVNGKRKTFRKYYYPLHDAVAEHDAELIRVLLAAGADPTLRSSSGKTALERANKWNNDGSLSQVCSVLEAAAPVAAH